MVKRKTIGYISVIFLIFILLFPSISAERNYEYSFHLVKKLPINVNQMVYNMEDKLIYTYDSHEIIVMDATTNTIQKEILMINDSYNSMIYGLRGIGYNPVTKKIYLVASINETWAIDANNYHVIKRIHTESLMGYSGVYPIYVDEKTNTVYVQTYFGYIVIDGKKDTFIKTISDGVLDFEHNAIWNGYTDDTNKTYIMKITDISTGKVIKMIKTDIPEDRLYWSPQMYKFGDKLFVQSSIGLSIIEYDMNNYKILHIWKDVNFKLGYYDNNKQLLYGTYSTRYFMNGSGEKDEHGILAFDTSNGMVVGKIDNITWKYDFQICNPISIISVNPITYNLYISVKKAQSEKTELQIYTVEGNPTPPTPINYVTISVIIITSAGALIAGIWIYHRKKQLNMGESG